MSLVRRLLFVLLALVAMPAMAQTFPPLSGRVVDAAKLLSPDQTKKLEDLSAQIEKASSRQFVVATIPDLQGYPIEDYGYRLGRAWKIGQGEANNGIVLLVAPKERKVRIEVGYGLEPIMTDAMSSVIINDTILPRFKAGDMPGGIMAGATAIGQQMTLPLEAAEQKAKQAATAAPAHRASKTSPIAVIFWIIVIVVIILPMALGGARGRRYRGSGGIGEAVLWGSVLSNLASGRGGGGSSWGGGGGGDWGGGGGGGFSGGGGSFGGGGASGSW
ncbi:TPM domain-containing protein [Sphingomonas sp. AR_OL41]|uniref:TPM domain-containing protein n=1 Tax=Sphingomonas sp. AR_OL41 TaxID=3042729 RepID=UPI002480CED4|nr:TPM domain-containing protein [Sphingomonas sp. AR_OL41]MDH7975560.1 TPM domain-containing protein [Sphingomonas sp. AR_OL41]